MVSAPHPLAAALIERLHSSPTSRVLDFAAGNGRNADALRAAGFTVVPIDDAAAASRLPLSGIDGRFDAAISTHGLLHGTVSIVASNLAAITEGLDSKGLLYATFGSTRDARFGQGQRLDDWSFSPIGGDERGVAHAYFDRERLVALLERHYTLECLEERDVDTLAGEWAHRERRLQGAVHWFAIAQKK
jgi:hypothetical protein